MTRETLQKALETANSKKQLGILIWGNWKAWDENGFELTEGNPIFDVVISGLEKGLCATHYVSVDGFVMHAFLSVPIKQTLSSQQMFDDVLNACASGKYNGPISIMPTSEIMEV